MSNNLSGNISTTDIIKATSLSTATMSGFYITSLKNRLFMVGSTDNFGSKNAIFFSDLNNGASWNPLNYIIVDTKDWNNITGLASFYDQLYIFKESSIYSFFVDNIPGNWTIRLINNEYGTLNQRSLSILGNQLFFLGRKGVYALHHTRVLDYFDVELKSFKIEPDILNIIANSSSVCAVTYKNQYWLSCPDNHVTYVFDLVLQCWTKYSFAHTAFYNRNGTLLSAENPLNFQTGATTVIKSKAISGVDGTALSFVFEINSNYIKVGDILNDGTGNIQADTRISNILTTFDIEVTKNIDNSTGYYDPKSLYCYANTGFNQLVFEGTPTEVLEAGITVGMCVAYDGILSEETRITSIESGVGVTFINISSYCLGDIDDYFNFYQVANISCLSVVKVNTTGYISADMPVTGFNIVDGTVVLDKLVRNIFLSQSLSNPINHQTLTFTNNKYSFVYKQDVGYNDDGQAINPYLYTKYFDFHMPERIKKIKKILYFAEQFNEPTTVNFDLYYDFNVASTKTDTQNFNASGGALYGLAIYGTDRYGAVPPGEETVRLPLSGQARFAQVKFSNTGYNQPFRIRGFTIMYKPKSMR
jgi:hypothetical protein